MNVVLLDLRDHLANLVHLELRDLWGLREKVEALVCLDPQDLLETEDPLVIYPR